MGDGAPGSGAGHDWWHTWRVRQMAVRIAREEGADLYIVELAALLHDLADHKFHGGDDQAGPQAARRWLSGQGADDATIQHVCRIIVEVSFRGADAPAPTPSSLEAMVVQDADRLDAIGAIGIARAFAYGGYRERPLHDPGVAPRKHASFEEYKKSSSATINHFYEKLLLLRDRMNTTTARRIAERRHDYMEDFLERFYREWEGED
jgi:uncharacterized protein